MLPEGWTIDRVRAVAQGAAELFSTEAAVIVDEFVDGPDGSRIQGTAPLTPSCILKFVDLFLVQDSADGWWYMGSATSEGTIHCWSGYGNDLEEAIKAL